VRADQELKVVPINHPAPPLNVLLSRLVVVAQFASMGAIFADHPWVPPGLRENKMPSCVGAFFIGNMISSGMTKTNAFEIYLDKKLLWSTLQTQRKPSMHDLVNSFAKVGIQIQA